MMKGKDRPVPRWRPFYWPLLAASGLALSLAACTSAASAPVAVAPPVPAADTAASPVAAAESAAPATTDTATGAEAVLAVDPPPPPPPEPDLTVQLPSGMAAYRWATDLAHPTALAFAPDGRLFVAEQEGRIWTLRDTDGNGMADQRVLFLDGISPAEVEGIAAVSATAVYVSHRTQISLAADLDADGVGDTLSGVIRGLPAGVYQNRGLLLAPDGLLYVTVGATCGDCAEPNRLAASVLVMDPATRQFEVYARGLRNPVALAVDPQGVLWVTDRGAAAPCATPDEVNRLRQDQHYGWPYCEATERPARTEDPLLTFPAGSNIAGLTWFESVLYPPTLSGGFYLALSGSLDGETPRVVFAQRQPDGRYAVRDFAGGMQAPVAVTVGPDGALYVADGGAGVIYRIGASPDASRPR